MADAPPEWTWHPMGLAFLQPGLPLCPPPATCQDLGARSPGLDFSSWR